MWFNGAAADSDQSVGTQIQDSGAECNSREPQPDDILPAEQLEGNAAVSPLADANEAVHAQHLNILEQVWEGCQQQQHAEQAVIRQTLSLSDEQSGVHQQQHGAADPAQMQSAESLSAWLGSEAASRTASIGLADTPPLEAPSAGFQTDSCASIPVHHCATADTAADLSNSDEHGQDSHQLPVTRRHVQEADVIGGVEKSQHIQPPTSAPPASAVNRLQYSQLSVSQGDTNEPECDIYNLESPGPILIAGHNGTLVSHAESNDMCTNITTMYLT